MILLVLMGVFAITSVESYHVGDSGDGKVHFLNVLEDVVLERGSRNFNYLNQLIIARLRQFPLKRSLLRFESLPASCPTQKIRWAKMYVYYYYAHKASWHTLQSSPALTHTINIHRVLKPWKESQATSLYRVRNVRWTSTYLNLGRDAERHPQYPPTTLYTSHPRSFIELDVTRAVVDWRMGAPNYGVLMKVVNEAQNGRGLRFISNAHKDKTLHARIQVMCDY